MLEGLLQNGANDGGYLVVDQDVLHFYQVFFVPLEEGNPKKVYQKLLNVIREKSGVRLVDITEAQNKSLQLLDLVLGHFEAVLVDIIQFYLLFYHLLHEAILLLQQIYPLHLDLILYLVTIDKREFVFDFVPLEVPYFYLL